MRIRFLAAVLLALPAYGAGEVWRYPEKDVPSTAPTTVDVAPPGGKSAVSVEVVVRDNAGAPVVGQSVFAVAVRGKKAGPRLEGATGPDGKLVLRGIDRDVDSLRLVFSWDGGAKTIRPRLDAKRGKWSLEAAPYKRIGDGKDDGSCKNLFALKPLGPQSYTLEFRRAPSLVWCEQIPYGGEKKSREYARIDAIGGRSVNRGDKNMFSAADETKIGLEASSDFDKQFEQVSDPMIVGYVTALAQKVAAASDDPKMTLNVRVVNTKDVNAFVTAGGHVYVFTGLLLAAQNESQVAGVLAHEISHAIARHVTEGATRNQMAQTGAQLGSAVLGSVLGLGDETQGLVNQAASTSAQLVTLKYDRGSESEADLLGTQYLWKAGWDPEGIARFFEQLQKRGKSSSVPGWLSTHPPHEKRVENGILWARAFLPPKDRYLVDTAEFEAVKAKVAKLPPPKEAAAPTAPNTGR